MMKIVDWFRGLGRRYQLIVVVIILLLLDYIVHNLMTFGYVYDLSGQIKTPQEAEKVSLMLLFKDIPVLSVLIGSIVGLFLSKKNSYKERFIHSTLIVLIILYVWYCSIGVRNILY